MSYIIKSIRDANIEDWAVVIFFVAICIIVLRGVP
jgi:hypothetical protein